LKFVLLGLQWAKYALQLPLLAFTWRVTISNHSLQTSAPTFREQRPIKAIPFDAAQSIVLKLVMRRICAPHAAECVSDFQVTSGPHS
jgi:hypothetical protein